MPTSYEDATAWMGSQSPAAPEAAPTPEASAPVESGQGQGEASTSTPTEAPQPEIFDASQYLIVNLVAIRLLHAHKEENINIRGAFLHVMADSLGSVGVLIAGFIILTTGWTLIDPLISLVICCIILWSSWAIIRDAVHILLLGGAAAY